MLTVVDLHGAGAANGGTTVTNFAPTDPDARAGLIAAAADLPRSPSMAALLVALEQMQTHMAAYRVGVINAIEPTNAAEIAMVTVRQKVMAAEATEPEPILRAKVTTIVMTIDGVLDRFRDVHRQLMMIEHGLAPLTNITADILDWGHAIGYPAETAP